jgi:hypothetical protein
VAELPQTPYKYSVSTPGIRDHDEPSKCGRDVIVAAMGRRARGKKSDERQGRGVVNLILLRFGGRPGSLKRLTGTRASLYSSRVGGGLTCSKEIHP